MQAQKCTCYPVLDFIILKDVIHYLQFVHKHLMEVGGGKVSELTPTALYEIFIELCRTKLHIIISYNIQDENMLKLIRKHKAILNASVQCILKVSEKNQLFFFVFFDVEFLPFPLFVKHSFELMFNQ